MSRIFCSLAAWIVVATMAVSATAGESEKYTLRYQFHPGEMMRWDVEHRCMIRTTISGTTQTAETLSKSVKVWRVADVAAADGAATFVHSVERVDMRQNLTGRAEVRYNSLTDKKPPVGFEDAAKSVGVPLSTVTLDAKGKVLQRQRHEIKGAKPAESNPLAQNENFMTIPLPDGPVSIGHTWTIPQDIDIPLPSGGVKNIKAIQQFTLEEVKTGVAIIRVSTEVLTPITDPAIESQLVQRETEGKVRFDIDAGRILGQQMDIDKRVVGFRGDASSIHYVNRFSEQIVAETDKTAGKNIKRD